MHCIGLVLSVYNFITSPNMPTFNLDVFSNPAPPLPKIAYSAYAWCQVAILFLIIICIWGFIQDFCQEGKLDSMYFSTHIISFAFLVFVVEFYLAVVL